MPGQTLSEIRGLLADRGLSPRHRYGQNFLIDLNLMRKLVAAAGVRAGDLVLEVGPGTGSLTEMLLATGASVIAVEIDAGLQEILRQRLGDNPRFRLITGDALAGKRQVNPEALAALRQNEPAAGGGRKLVANLPYQIATPLIMECLYADPPFELIACTIQKEVAERLTAKPDSEAYGPVSIITETLANVESVARLPPSVFWPQPQVESSMLLLRAKPRDQLAVPADRIAGFVAFVQRAFLHRRQTLRRIVGRWKQPHVTVALAEAGIDPNARPEDLSPDAWRRLFFLSQPQ